MLLFLILLSIAVDNINAIGIKVGAETQYGHWPTIHEISIPFTVGGKTYFFGITGNMWIIQELRRDGTIGVETSRGTFLKYYIKALQFNIDGRQFIYCIDGWNYWFIQEILPGGKMGEETDRGYWKSQPTIIFPLNVHGNHYVFSLTDTNWFIRKLIWNGQLGSLIDEGSWNNYYTLGFPFSINGRQYIYCLSDYYWFIQEIKDNGKMGEETDNGHWTSKHILYFPFDILGKQYFYGVNYVKTYWFIQELLPGGKMGSEKTNGMWQNYYDVMFPFKIDGNQYFYGDSGYDWFIQQVLQDPSFRQTVTNTREYCNQVSNKTHCVSDTRKKRQLDTDTCSCECRGLNFVEEYVTDIRNDNFYTTSVFDNPANAIHSYSVFPVPANNPNEPPIFLTAAIEAEIHYINLNNVRQPISQAVRDHLRNLDRQNDDDAGHLLADSLGGPVLPYNFVPQSPMLNRRVSVAGSRIPQQGWYDVEDLIRNYIRATNGYVRWSLAIIYGNLQNTRRPTDFLLSVRLYTECGELTGWQGNSAVTGYHFRNVPTVACTSFNHAWWNIPY